MDQADQQDRSCRPACEGAGVRIVAPQPAPALRRAGPRLGHRLAAAATTTAALLVGLNAFAQMLNVLAAWWGLAR